MTNLKFNVAQLLREPIGARRDHEFTEAHLGLDDALTLRDISGMVRFTRTSTGVFVHVHASGFVDLICVRSLEHFAQLVDLDFCDEFHSIIDVVTGAAVPKPLEEDPFLLDELHMADIGEVLREYTLLALPINPVSEAYRDAPVSYTVESEGIDAETVDGEKIDKRLEALKAWTERQNEIDI